MKIALLSIDDLTGFVADDELVVGPLRELGHVAEFVSWQQTGVAWREYGGVIIRTTWNYQHNLAAFLAALQKIESQTRLANPFEIVQWNADKKIYLQHLAQKGAKTVPTIWNDRRIDSHQIEEWFDQLRSDELVIKPTVGANAHDALRVKRGDQDAALLNTLFDNRSYMIQPFMNGITEEGEFSLFYIDGDFSHAILKMPKPGDFRVQEEHGGIIKSIEPSPALLAAGKEVLKHISPALLYARVDLVRTQKEEFALMELELIEPSLYLRTAAHAPRFFAEGIDRWMRQTKV
jgi:glutathione synthase/RimK-type ligase-like ATP-grasp enzyme